jgi:hypothetical protein
MSVPQAQRCVIYRQETAGEQGPLAPCRKEGKNDGLTLWTGAEGFISNLPLEGTGELSTDTLDTRSNLKKRRERKKAMLQNLVALTGIAAFKYVHRKSREALR